MSEPVHEFKEGQPVWVEDGDGKRHPGVFAGENQNASWFGGGPSALVVHAEADQSRGGIGLPNHVKRRIGSLRNLG
jgi:hypothetical protein